MQTKSKRKVLLLPVILSLLALLLAACGGSTNGNNSSSSVTPASADKQVFRSPVEGGDFDSLDPALTVGGLGDPYNLIYSGLVTLKDDGSVANDLAQSYQVSPDGLSYTFTLKSGLKFSDGSPITADDVAYSLNRVLLPATKSTVTYYLGLLKDYDAVTNGKIQTLIGDSIIVKDPQTIELIISHPAAYFLESLTYSTGDVVEKKLIDQYGAKWTDHLEEGGGDGPFKVSNYGHTTNLTLVPNSNYYGFTPKIKKIIYTIASDRDTNYKAFQAGQYDIAPVPPALDGIAMKKPGYQHVSALASRFIEMNWLVKPLDNVHIRQALALAINKDLIVGRVINTVAPVVTPSNHIVPNGIPGYNPDLLGPAGVKGTAGDATKAKALFAQGLQEEGLTVSSFPSLTLTYISSYKAGGDTMTAVAAEWQSVLGVNIKVVGEDANQFYTDQSNTIGKTGPFQLWYGNWGADYPDPQDWLTNFFGQGASENYENYGQNKSADAANQVAVQQQLAKADADSNTSERLKIYQQAEQQIVDEVGWITTYQSAYVYSTNPKLQGWHLNPLGTTATTDWQNIFIAA